MVWYDNTYKLGIKKLDFGKEFSIHERFEYTILTYDEQGNQGEMPGHFDSLFGGRGIREAVKRLSEIVKEETSHDCEINYTPKTFILTDLSEDKIGKLKIRVGEKIQRMKIRKGFMGLQQRGLNGSPGGNPNHDCR